MRVYQKNRIFRSFSKDYEEDKSKSYRLLMVGVGGRSSTSFTGRLMEVLDKAIRENVNTPAEEPMNVSGVSNPLGMSPHTKDNEESSYEV